jgi:hypothetical protein
VAREPPAEESEHRAADEGSTKYTRFAEIHEPASPTTPPAPVGSTMLEMS